MKRIITKLLCLILAAIMLITFAACNEAGPQGEKGEQGEKGDTGAKGNGVKSAVVNAEGHLILTLDDNSTVDAGKIVDVHPHEIKEKVIVERAPTCTATGLSYVTCETCGELLKTVITEKLPHDYEDVVTPPTCTEKGYTTHTCKDCAHVEVDTYVDAKGHAFESEYTYDEKQHWKNVTYGHTDAVVKANHTYDEEGICTVCGYDSASILSFTFEKIEGKDEYRVIDFASGIKKAVIPSEYEGLPVTEIDAMTFYQNTTVETVVIPETVTAIPASLFKDCSALKSVTIPSSVTSIGNYAFSGCSSLTSITIPSSVTSIGDSAFYYCRNLTSITIPSSVTSIGEIAFEYCSSLTSITIPSSVTSIGYYAFYGCPCYQSDKGVWYVDTWVLDCETSVTRAIIREGTKGIGSYAFEYCRSLTSITIPSSVTSIGERAFYDCRSLTSITFQGTKAQWSAISKGSSWNDSTGSYTIHCTDGDIAKS